MVFAAERSSPVQSDSDERPAQVGPRPLIVCTGRSLDYSPGSFGETLDLAAVDLVHAALGRCLAVAEAHHDEASRGRGPGEGLECTRPVSAGKVHPDGVYHDQIGAYSCRADSLKLR